MYSTYKTGLKDLHACGGRIQLHKNAHPQIFPTDAIDASNNETTTAINGYIMTPVAMKKKYTREKRKLVRKGEFIPIEELDVDIFGYTIQPEIKDLLKRKKMYVPAKFTRPRFVLNRQVSLETSIIPYYTKTQKYKTPCGSSIDYIKNYLQFILSQNDEQLKKYCFIHWLYYKELPNANLSKNNHTRIKWYQHQQKYILNSGRIFHRLFPDIMIKCPCELLGEHVCKKRISSYELFFICRWLSVAQTRVFSEWFLNWTKSILMKLINDSEKQHIIKSNKHLKTKRGSCRLKKKKYVNAKIHHSIHKIRCEFCMNEHIITSYYSKKSMKVRKNKNTYYMNKIKCNCPHSICKLCGNGEKKHMDRRLKGKCPKPVGFEKVTDEELNKIKAAFDEDNVETSNCPTCGFIVTKDEHCDKVKCGRVDGGRMVGCGTSFCFRCSEDISRLGSNYLDHLVVTMKEDGSNTTWICRKFAKECPDCNIKQFWNGKSSKIKCGSCLIEFNV